ncbi:MAG: signal peptide peptidase SppA [Bacteroidetes bacterium]|nr:signal peptide peptidase SppA [Bacteroidota bacterium]
MKQFFKIMFASMLGTFLIFLIPLIMLFGMISLIGTIGTEKAFDVNENTVLQLKFESEIVDRSSDNPFESFDFMSGKAQSAIGLNDMLKNVKKAGADNNIKGIFLDMTGINAGYATIAEIRNELLKFKESGKFIIAYGESYSQKAYYLASVADEVYLNPVGMIDFSGLNMQSMFFKNLLEKIGIEAQVIKHGDYKSAGEPFYLEKMSDANREQMLSIASSMWNSITNDISKSRNLSLNHINNVANGLLTRKPSLALDNSMIDGIKHRDEIMDNIRQKLGLGEKDKINFASYAQYKNAPMPKELLNVGAKDYIAVIYGMGNIISGEGGDYTMGSDRIAEAIREARLNDKVKAIVFRINSGGGSALASDVMLREIKLASEVKPVVASFGDVAASGGYYVACAADKIIANPSTITGSIGVFGMIPNMKDLFNQKLGITFDNVKTNTLADFGATNRPLTATEKELIQEMIGEIYDTFITHVSEGRSLPKETVDNIGRGRVWTGSEAKDIGLIDDFGGLEYAIVVAAELAELENYRIIEYPKKKTFIEMLLADMGGVREYFIKQQLGENYIVYKQIQTIKESTGILARIPFEMIID